MFKIEMFICYGCNLLLFWIKGTYTKLYTDIDALNSFKFLWWSSDGNYYNVVILNGGEKFLIVFNKRIMCLYFLYIFTVAEVKRGAEITMHSFSLDVRKYIK